MATGSDEVRTDQRGSPQPTPVRLVPPLETAERVSGETLAELRRLDERAASGPWWFAPDPTPQRCAVHGPTGPVAAGLGLRDAELITAVRSHLPALLDEVERLRSRAATLGATNPTLEPTGGSSGGARRGLVRRMLSRAGR